jgi:hypothetical protein
MTSEGATRCFSFVWVRAVQYVALKEDDIAWIGGTRDFLV